MMMRLKVLQQLGFVCLIVSSVASSNVDNLRQKRDFPLAFAYNLSTGGIKPNDVFEVTLSAMSLEPKGTPKNDGQSSSDSIWFALVADEDNIPFRLELRPNWNMVKLNAEVNGEWRNPVAVDIAPLSSYLESGKEFKLGFVVGLHGKIHATHDGVHVYLYPSEENAAGFWWYRGLELDGPRLADVKSFQIRHGNAKVQVKHVKWNSQMTLEQKSMVTLLSQDSETF